MDIELRTIKDENVSLFDDFLLKEWKNEDLRIFQRHVDSSEWKKLIYIVAKNKDSKEILGLIKGHITGGDFYIGHILVKKSFRGLKIGKLLMIRAFEEAKDNNCHIMTLKTTTKHDVLNFYLKYGFKEIGRITDGAFHLTWIFMSNKITITNQNN